MVNRESEREAEREMEGEGVGGALHNHAEAADVMTYPVQRLFVNSESAAIDCVLCSWL